MTHKIAIAGYGYIGKSLHELLEPFSIDVSCIYNRSKERLEGLGDLGTTDMEEFVSRCEMVDLIVELAHPDISRQWGARLLQLADYMPCSVTALADDALQRVLIETANQNNNRLLIPHGAVVGIDNILEARDNWDALTITFRKPPASVGDGEEPDEDESVLFDGSVREAAEKFPRNVNAMVACALACVGIDKARAVMVVDKRVDMLRGEFEFTGKDGSRLTIIKEEPARGVSSPGMITSLKGSVLRALQLEDDGMIFV